MEKYFYKLHGLGNDMIVIDDRDNRIAPYDMPRAARKLCNRRTGIGGDCLLVAKDTDAADIAMLVYNSDGTQAEMCGNGIRCFARVVYESGIIPRDEFTVDTLAGVKRPQLLIKDGEVKSVRVDMGVPKFLTGDIPMDCGTEEFIMQPIASADREFIATAVNSGIPQLIVFTDDVRSLDLEKYGLPLEHHPYFPEKTNVSFVEVEDRRTLVLRTWERGCGVTLCCGTGATAAAAACIRSGLTDRVVSVRVPLGALRIEWDGESNIYMSGPAEKVFEGRVDI
ncbi:MAG: diaminopimelate epimerase [Clostridia bacterium]|nr:diaminopimelate epimerase [Clostridia bacterium]